MEFASIYQSIQPRYPELKRQVVVVTGAAQGIYCARPACSFRPGASAERTRALSQLHQPFALATHLMDNKRKSASWGYRMINLEVDFAAELTAIFEASGIITIARKRLADAQEAGEEHEILLQNAAVVGAETLLAKAYEGLGRAVFDAYQRSTGEYPLVNG